MDYLKNGLEEYLIRKNYVREESKILNEEVDEFIRLYPNAAKDIPDTYKIIPKFFRPVSINFNLFIRKLLYDKFYSNSSCQKKMICYNRD